MNIDSPFEQWRLKYMKGTAASSEIMELLALAFEGGRVAEQSKYSDIVSDGGLDPRNKFDAQPEQEPVAWMLPDYGDVLSASEADGTGIYNIPLYTAPPKPEPKSISTNDHLCAMLRQVHDVLACTALPMKRQWVGLTQEDRDELLNGSTHIPSRLIDWVEQKLKEKNVGNNT